MSAAMCLSASLKVAFVPGAEHELHGWMLRLEPSATVILPLLALEAPDRESRERRDDTEVRAGWQQVFHGSSFARPEHRMNFHLRAGS